MQEVAPRVQETQLRDYPLAVEQPYLQVKQTFLAFIDLEVLLSDCILYGRLRLQCVDQNDETDGQYRYSHLSFI